MTVGPRLLARLDVSARQWRSAAGTDRVALGRAAAAPVLAAEAQRAPRPFGR